MCYIRYILYIFLTVDVNILFGAPAHFQFKIRSVPWLRSFTNLNFCGIIYDIRLSIF